MSSSPQPASRTSRAIIRQYCNLASDLDELQALSKQVLAEDTKQLKDMKQRIQTYMREHKIDCMYDEVYKKFLYRATMNKPRPITEEVQGYIISEIEKAEAAGTLVVSDMESFVLEIVDLIQNLRKTPVEVVKTAVKKPATVREAVTPTVRPVAARLSQYFELETKHKDLSTHIAETKKQIQSQINDVKPAIEEFCSAKKLVRKKMNFPRRRSTMFAKCASALDPEYFNRVKHQSGSRYLTYKQSKARNRKVTSLRPSKKLLKDVATELCKNRATWKYSEAARHIFQRLQQDAEASILKKLEENETNKVFKLGGKLILSE